MMFHAENSGIAAEDSETINTSSGCMLRFMLSGSGIQTVKDHSMLLHAGDIFLCGPQTTGTFYAISACQVTDVCFSLELAELSGLPVKDIVIRTLPQDMFHELLSFVNAFTVKKSPRYNYFQAEQLSAFAQSAVYFLRDGSIVTDIRQRMADILIFIHSNYQRDITLHDLADIAGTSVSHLRRQFMQAMGKSAIDYLLELRLAKASKRLSSTSSSIAEIALKTGFNDANYFTRIFTSKYGISPRAWRKNNAEK